jgi:hypothetical protein
LELLKHLLGATQNGANTAQSSAPPSPGAAAPTNPNNGAPVPQRREVDELFERGIGKSLAAGEFI